jgi:hypothetical protein
MKVKIKIISSCTCYTTLLVGDKKHTIPTRELQEWLDYYRKQGDR